MFYVAIPNNLIPCFNSNQTCLKVRTMIGIMHRKQYDLGTVPTQYLSILGVLLRAIYNHIIIIIQLLMRGASVPATDVRLTEK